MIKELNNELQAKALADSLGLIITKYKGIYLVSNSKEEMLDSFRYNLGYGPREGILYDRDIFKGDEYGLIVIRDTTLVDASSIELPYGIKGPMRMFRECTSLKTPPIIPEGVKDCSFMFIGCTSLTTPPIIPDSVKNCSFMFSGCTSLVTPPTISEGVKDCSSMFDGCTSLEIPPIIPKDVEYCSNMFRRCTSLKELPHFPKKCYLSGALGGTPFEEEQRLNAIKEFNSKIQAKLFEMDLI